MRTAILLLALLWPLGAFAAEVHVNIRNAKIRKSASWISATVEEPAYGQALEVLGKSAGWYKVQGSEASGWIQGSAVTARKVKVGKASTVGSTRTYADEVTLAGRGFTPLEKDYRDGGGKGNLEAVDAMDARKVDEAALLAFLRQGALLPKKAKRKTP